MFNERKAAQMAAFFLGQTHESAREPAAHAVVDNPVGTATPSSSGTWPVART